MDGQCCLRECVLRGCSMLLVQVKLAGFGLPATALKRCSAVTDETEVEVDHACELLQVLKRGGPWEIPYGLHLGR